MTYEKVKVLNFFKTMAIIAFVFFYFPSSVYSTPKDINILIQELKNKDPNIRCKAVASMGNKRNDVRVIKPLIDALKDKDDVVRSMARDALINIASRWKINDIYAVEPLIEAFKDEDEFVRAWSAMALGYIAALGKINNPRIIESLHALLNDKDSDVRDMADEALGRINEKQIKPKDEKTDSDQIEKHTKENISPQRAGDLIDLTIGISTNFNSPQPCELSNRLQKLIDDSGLIGVIVAINSYPTEFRSKTWCVVLNKEWSPPPFFS